MKRFTQTTELVFEPFKSAGIDITATGADKYTTPPECRERLDDLARLEYVSADFRGVVEFNGDETDAQITLRLTDGATDYATLTLAADGTNRIHGEATGLDLTALDGSKALRIVADVDTIGAVANVAYVAGVLRLRFPLTVFGGC